MFAVDPVLPVAQEAAEWGAQLLVVHHPLFLKGVHGVAGRRRRAGPSGASGRRLRAPDRAHERRPGGGRGLGGTGTALGLTDLGPSPAGDQRLDKLTTYVPVADADGVRRALARAGAGVIGDYDSASFSTPGEGRFRPLEGADPTIGEVGALEVVDEVRIECVLARAPGPRWWRRCWRRTPTRSRRTTSWSSPTPARPRPAAAGSARSRRPRSTASRVRWRARCRATAHGVRVAGDPDRVVRRVAVCGGAGDFLLDAVRRTDADVYVTSDLRHHPASEFLEQGGPALVDVAHWAAESTWLPVVAAKADRRAGGYGGDQGQHPVHRPVDAAHPQEKSAESRPRRPARPAGPPGARRARRPAAPPARDAPRARRDRGARRPPVPSSTAGGGTRRSRSTTSPPSRPRSTPTSSRSRPGARATRTGWTRG